MKRTLYLLLAVALITGCRQSDEPATTPAKNQLCVSVAGLVAQHWGTHSRAATAHTIAGTATADTLWLNDSIYVEAVIDHGRAEQEPDTRATVINYPNQISNMSIVMFNTGSATWNSATATQEGSGSSPMKVKVSNGNYAITPAYSWIEGDMKYRTLIALSPSHDSAGLSLSNDGQTLEVTVQSDAKDHHDLCVSNIDNNKDIQYTVGSNKNLQQFEMHHAMTAVGFEAAGYDLMLTGVKLIGVNSRATLTLHNRTWSAPDTPADFAATINANQWLDSDHLETYNPWRNITPNDGYMMMIPQSHTDDMKLEFTFDGRNGQPGGTYALPLNQIKAAGAENSDWKPGMKVTYRLRLKTQPAVRQDEIAIPSSSAGETVAFTITTSTDDDLTFSWTASWLGLYRGTEIIVSNPESNGYFSPLVTGVSNWTDMKFFARNNNNSITAPRTATVTVTGKKSGTKTFKVTQPAKIDGFDYTREPANCYVGYLEDGKYQNIVFNALRKPIYKYRKGSPIVKNLTGDNRYITNRDQELSNNIIYQSGDKIEVTWQTAVNHQNSGAMVIKSITLDHNGKATVAVNGPGNAVLSYKRGSTILWNYHIWVTESNPFINHADANTSGNFNGVTPSGQARFMDRNLGALAATTSKPAAEDAYKYFGLLYQYSRSTPFSGPGAGTTPDYTYIFNKNGSRLSSTIGGYTPKSNAVSSITDAIQNPTTYYFGKFDDKWSWYNTDITLWTNPAWEKSIHDPCPYGYRIPGDRSWDGFTASRYSKIEPANGSIWCGTWWPIVSSRVSNTGRFSTGGGTNYWSSSYCSPHSSSHFYFDYSGHVSSSNCDNRSNGFSVRCIQEGW